MARQSNAAKRAERTESQMNNIPDIGTEKKVKMAISNFLFELKNIFTLGILPREKAALKRMGYDPKAIVCIERFDDESVFAEIKIGNPIRIGLLDGGGKPYKYRMRLQKQLYAQRMEQEKESENEEE